MYKQLSHSNSSNISLNQIMSSSHFNLNTDEKVLRVWKDLLHALKSYDPSIESVHDATNRYNHLLAHYLTTVCNQYEINYSILRQRPTTPPSPVQPTTRLVRRYLTNDEIHERFPERQPMHDELYEYAQVDASAVEDVPDLEPYYIADEQRRIQRARFY